MDVNGVRTLEDVLASGAAPLVLTAAQMLDIMDGLQVSPPRAMRVIHTHLCIQFLFFWTRFVLLISVPQH